MDPRVVFTWDPLSGSEAEQRCRRTGATCLSFIEGYLVVIFAHFSTELLVFSFLIPRSSLNIKELVL